MLVNAAADDSNFPAAVVSDSGEPMLTRLTAYSRIVDQGEPHDPLVDETASGVEAPAEAAA